MDINNLPNFIFTDNHPPKENVYALRFIVVEINGHYFIAAKLEPTTHNAIKVELEKDLLKSDYHGEYGVYGGGTIHVSDNHLRASDVSGSFGVFDKDIAENILRKEFTNMTIEVKSMKRYRSPTVFVLQ